MGDKSEIIDVEYENGTKGGDVIDKGGASSQYGATINISYSWNPSCLFNYSSLAMTLNGNTYLPKTSSSYVAIFSYSTDLSNVTSYNINVFYTIGSGITAQHKINYIYDVSTGVGTMPGTNPSLNN